MLLRTGRKYCYTYYEQNIKFGQKPSNWIKKHTKKNTQENNKTKICVGTTDKKKEKNMKWLGEIFWKNQKVIHEK